MCTHLSRLPTATKAGPPIAVMALLVAVIDCISDPAINDGLCGSGVPGSVKTDVQDCNVESVERQTTACVQSQPEPLLLLSSPTAIVWSPKCTTPRRKVPCGGLKT